MPNRSAEHRIQELLDALRIGLDLDLAFVGEFANGNRVFRFVSGSLAEMRVAPGQADPLEASYCHWIAAGRIPEVIPNALDVSFACDLPATAEGVRAHVGIPLELSDGRVFGSLCAAGTAERAGLDEGVLTYVRNIARVIAHELEAILETQQDLDRRESEVRDLIAGGRFTSYLQPVAHLETGRVVGVEALTRFQSEPYRRPDEWFAQAWDVGLGVELELATARLAIEVIDELDPSVPLAVNVSPATLLSDEFVDSFARYGSRLVVEVTEHAAIEDYGKLGDVVQPLTDLGIQLAVDDVGAGYASLSHILQLAPDVMKLDISLTRDIERDVARHALVSALVAFADGVDARLVAEGLETDAARDALRSLGVRLGQGYLLARPAPAETVVRDLAARGWYIDD